MYELECGNRRKRKVKASLKQMLTVGMRLKKGTLHIIFNSVLPGADVSSDFFTFLELWAHSDIGWAIAVLFFMFLPFLFKFSEFVVDLCRGKVKENNVVGLLLHLPFVFLFFWTDGPGDPYTV